MVTVRVLAYHALEPGFPFQHQNSSTSNNNNSNKYNKKASKKRLKKKKADRKDLRS